MFEPQLAALRFTAKSVQRKAVWGTVGGIFVLCSLIFFGIAGWIVLEERYGALTTALVFGGALLLIGILALLWAKRPPRVIPREAAVQMQNPMNSPALSAAAIVNAVILGITAGRAVRRRR